MRKLSIKRALAIIVACGMIAPSSRGASPHNSLHTIILFGARWCAPCTLEYRNLPALAAAAAPDRLTLAWIDMRIDPPSDLRDRIDVLDTQEARNLAEKLAGVGYGLPFSAMVDINQKVCAIHRGPLDPRMIEKMQRACAGIGKP